MMIIITVIAIAHNNGYGNSYVSGDNHNNSINACVSLIAIKNMTMIMMIIKTDITVVSLIFCTNTKSKC